MGSPQDRKEGNMVKCAFSKLEMNFPIETKLVFSRLVSG